MFDDLNVESYARFAYSELSRRIAELRRQLPHEAGEIVYLKHKSGHSYPSLRYRQNGKIKYKYIAKNKLDEVIAEQKQLQHYDMLLKQYLNLLAQAEKVLALFKIDKENPNSTVSAAPLSFLSSDRMLITAKGHSVRSKSELLIADALFYHGIRYEYEKELILSGRTIYPDFTIRHPQTGKIFYWEHLEIQLCEIILVVDSMVGQDAVNVAKAFNDLLEIDSVLLTKLDGDTRGGAALSIRAVTGKPIKYVGTGEKLDDIEEFHPSRMASRILGMGDVLSLIEKAEQQIDEKQAAEMAAKLKNNTFDMNDLLAQFQEIKKMGPLKQVMSMLPGMGNKLKDVDIDDRQLLRVESIIYSMTKRERERPDIINPSRKRRIAAGSGTSVEEVNRLLRQHEQMKKMFKQLNAKGKGKRGRGMQLPPGFKF